MAKVSSRANIRHVYAAMVRSAFAELRCDILPNRLDAALWITGPDYKEVANFLGAPSNGTYLMTSGKAREVAERSGIVKIERRYKENLDVIALFEGLTPQQAREFREQLIWWLPKLRAQIVNGKDAPQDE